MDLSNVTVQDCIDLYVMKSKSTIINAGKVVGFSDCCSSGEKGD